MVCDNFPVTQTRRTNQTQGTEQGAEKGWFR